MCNTFRAICILLLLLGMGNARANEILEAAAGKAIQAGFTELERQLIEKYLDGEPQPAAPRSGIVFNNVSLQKKKEQSLPAGLQKKPLPPGLAAQLQRNGTLPPGLAMRALPPDLEKQLPPLPAGYERSILDDLTVILIETATHRIVDMIVDTVGEQNNKPARKNDR